MFLGRIIHVTHDVYQIFTGIASETNKFFRGGSQRITNFSQTPWEFCRHHTKCQAIAPEERKNYPQQCYEIRQCTRSEQEHKSILTRTPAFPHDIYANTATNEIEFAWTQSEITTKWGPCTFDLRFARKVYTKPKNKPAHVQNFSRNFIAETRSDAEKHTMYTKAHEA